MPGCYDSAAGVSELRARTELLKVIRSGWRPAKDGELPRNPRNSGCSDGLPSAPVALRESLLLPPPPVSIGLGLPLRSLIGRGLCRRRSLIVRRPRLRGVLRPVCRTRPFRLLSLTVGLAWPCVHLRARTEACRLTLWWPTRKVGEYTFVSQVPGRRSAKRGGVARLRIRRMMLCARPFLMIGRGAESAGVCRWDDR